MTVWTKIVFPAIRIVIWAIIAGALVKIAFLSTPQAQNADDGLIPTSDFSAPTYTVETADIVNNVEVTATVVTDPSVEVKAGSEGYLGYWAVPNGADVIEGQPIAEIRKPIMSQAREDEDGNVIEPADTGRFTRQTLHAPLAGKLKYVVELDEEVTKTTVVFSVAPETLSVEGDLSPQDRYRLLDDPKKAEVKLDGGPAPFTCKKLAIGNDVIAVEPNPEDDSGEDFYGYEGQAQNDSTTAVKMRCPAPKKVRLFAGLTGTMTVLAGEAKGVVAVPITAVQGVLETGRVWVIDPATGEEVERDIKLGLSDGEMIEVVEGLEQGDSIRQFAPGNMEELNPEEEGMIW